MFQKKICVIVGGAKGRGRKLVEKYAGEKYRIAFMDIDKESGNSLKEKLEGEFGRKVFFFNGNVNSEEDRELFAGAVKAQYRKIDCLYYRSDIRDKREDNRTGNRNSSTGMGIEDLLGESLKKGSIVRDIT